MVRVLLLVLLPLLVLLVVVVLPLLVLLVVLLVLALLVVLLVLLLVPLFLSVEMLLLMVSLRVLLVLVLRSRGDEEALRRLTSRSVSCSRPPIVKGDIQRTRNVMLRMCSSEFIMLPLSHPSLKGVCVLFCEGWLGGAWSCMAFDSLGARLGRSVHMRGSMTPTASHRRPQPSRKRLCGQTLCQSLSKFLTLRVSPPAHPKTIARKADGRREEETHIVKQRVQQQ